MGIMSLAGPEITSVFMFSANVQTNKGAVMKVKRSRYANAERLRHLDGIWLPPKSWKIRLYKLLGKTAPDRWVGFKD